MQVNGLNRDRYLIDNPIWVDIIDIPEDTLYVSVAIIKLDTAGVEIPGVTPLPLRLTPSPDNTLYFDLSEGAKSFMAPPDFELETANTQPIETNYQKLKVVIGSVPAEAGNPSETMQTIKTFIRGGREGDFNNVTVAAGAVLKESTLIPRWGAYPVRKFYLNASQEIASTSIIPSAETEARREIGCNPIYFKFLNTSGGYGYWLFENWTSEKSTRVADRIENRDFNYSLGAAIEWELEVEGRVERRYFKTMRALIESSEVYVYNLDALLFSDQVGAAFNTARVAWRKVYNQNNKMPTDSAEDLLEVSFKFDVLNRKKPTLKW